MNLILGYLAFSVFVAMPVLALFVKYEEHMYPICHECGDNFYTSRRASWQSKWAWCRIHGFIG